MYWNPNPVAFTIPIIDLPIYLYGICFVTGFVLAYFLLIRLFERSLPEKTHLDVQTLVDQLTWFAVGGTVIGARLGHVLFYDWERYRENPWLILNTREGGLASHGGTIGIMIALAIYYHFIFKKKTGMTFLQLLDHMSVVTGLACFFIRLGNFFNQEILGTPTTLPWAVIFGAPADRSPPLPRHPAQLYEGIAYLLIFAILLYTWYYTSARLKQGFTTGLLFVLVFGSRFFIEYVKEHQYSILNQNVLQTGQILSLPFIIFGIYLMVRSFYYERKRTT